MRWEINQKAISLLPRARLKRLPMVCRKMKNRTIATMTATCQGMPRVMATPARTTQPMKVKIAPMRGSYWKRVRP